MAILENGLTIGTKLEPTGMKWILAIFNNTRMEQLHLMSITKSHHTATNVGLVVIAASGQVILNIIKCFHKGEK